MSNWKVEYSEFTGHVYFVMGRNKYDITDYVEHFVRKGKADIESKYICHEDCTNENCSMCIRWNKLSDCYEGE